MPDSKPNNIDIPTAHLLADLRLKVLDNILRAMFVLGGMATLVSSIEVSQEGNNLLAATYVALYGVIVVATFFWGLGFAVRATMFQFTLFALAVSELYFFGIASQSLMFLFGYVVFAGMFFGMRRGIFAFMVSLLALVATAWYYVNGVAPADLPMHGVSTELFNWPGPVLAFVFLSATALISITMLLSRLNESLLESRALLKNLKSRIEQNEETTRTLRASEARHSLLSEHGSEIIWETGPDQIITYVSPSVESVLGWTPENILGRPFIQTISLLRNADADALKERFKQFAEGESESVSGEANFRIKGGGRRWCSIRAVRVLDENGQTRCVQGVVRDISRRKTLEEQLLHSQKMEAMGQLAGGIAHDFNNLLGAIAGSAELLSISENLSEKQRKSVGIIERCSGLATKLTGQLLSFARKGKTTSVPIDVHALVRNVEQMLSHAIQRRIRIEITIAEGDEFPVGDPDQLQSALLNLCINARDAMTDGGVLRIETDYLDRETPVETEHGTLEPGRYLRVRVSDTGEGMDEETQKRIFEPFFTTKGAEKGTGLGLPSVLGCVESHGGWVEVESVIGEGTTFSMMLPLETPMHTPSGGVAIVKSAGHTDGVTSSTPN